MQFDQIVELAVDNRELVGDELLEHENVLVLVNVVESVDIGPEGPSQLPSVGLLHSHQTLVVRMQVLEFSDVDQIF